MGDCKSDCRQEKLNENKKKIIQFKIYISTSFIPNIFANHDKTTTNNSS